MKEREQGVLSVEASIVLTLMLLFVLFLFSFARVYRAQNLVSHATLQSADAVALESYLRETALQGDAADVAYLANLIAKSDAISADGLESLRSANLPKLAKQRFVAAIANSESKADEKLRSMGVKNGLDGIDFSESKMDLSTDDVIIAVSYTIELQYPVFGYDEISVTKAAKAKTFGEILFEVSTKPNNPGWGSTGGDNKVVHGSTVEITATPNYGYVFVGWDDGNTDNPREVTVNDSQKYTAIFEKSAFGINISTKIEYDTKYSGISHTSYGSAQGAGNYLYLDKAVLTATPSGANYQFKGWDLDGDGNIDNTNRTVNITVDKTYNNIRAVFKPAMCKVTVKTNNAEYGIASAHQGAKQGNSVEVEYGSKVQLVATSKDTSRYLFSKWNNNATQASVSLTVMGSGTYEALFIHNTYTVTFYNGNTLVSSVLVLRGSSIDGSAQLKPKPQIPTLSSNAKSVFEGWKYQGKAFTSETKVNGDIKVHASWLTPRVSIHGGEKGGRTTVLNLEKYPSNAVVRWKSSDVSIASVNSNGEVVALKKGTVRVTATLQYKGVIVEDSVSIQVEETTYTMGYCMNMDSRGRRHYTKEHVALKKTSRWDCYFPGTNHHCHKAQSYAKKYGVTQSELDAAQIVSDANWNIRYKGYNRSGEIAYVMWNGSGDAMYFILEKNGPGGSYITRIS